MDRIEGLRSRYTELLARYIASDHEIERETVLGEINELAKQALRDGPLLDQMCELHWQAQSTVAERWAGGRPGSPESRWRDRLVRGDAQPLMLAALVPHELALRAHHEKRWRREHGTLVAMFEQTDDMIVVLDDEGHCDDVNPAFCRLTGWSRREAVMGAAAWADPPRQASTQRVRTEQLRRDGSRFMIEWSVSPILGHRGELLSHVCIGRDVDHQQKIDDSLRENDKLRAMATLAGGIAHDFNNLLGSIVGLTELCELEAQPGTRQARNLARIRVAGDKAAALVRQMLDFSRQTPPALAEVGVAEWLDHAEGLLRAALPRHQVLSIEVTEDAMVRIDLIQMEQVLLNMVRNAAHAIGEHSGHVRIVADRSEPGSASPDGGSPGHARVRVIDDGGGIAPETLDKIFEPFFTTKPVGEGTGLGLAAAHGIVSTHGGTIEVHSEPGFGSSFSVFLPVVAAPRP